MSKRRRRVAIDVSAGINQGAGVGRTAREIVSALAEHPDAPRLTLFFARERSAQAETGMAWLRSLASAHPSIKLRSVPISPRWLTYVWLRRRLPLPIEALTGPIDLVLAPDFVAPPAARAGSIVTVHDLSFLTVPQYAEPGLRQYLTSAVPPAVRRARRVVAVSEATRQDVITHLGLAPERVAVVYNGVDARFRPRDAAAVATARRRLQLPDRVVLTVGTIEPRKNHLGLLRAFAQQAARHPDLTLIIGGRRGWLDQPVFDEVERLGLSQRVRFLGAVADADLPDLYACAAVFVFPSWYEGFGLPALEALATGIPVVTSQASSLPEVCGDAALLVDPADDGALAMAIERALGDDALRQRLSTAGPARAARFTWAAAADRLIQVFEAAAP